MACSVRLHKGATLPPPRLHIRMHRLIFLASVLKPFANPASALGVKPQACGGPPSPGKKGKPRQAVKRYGRPLLVYCPKNPKEYKLLLSPALFKSQHSSVTQGSPPLPRTLLQKECPSGKTWQKSCWTPTQRSIPFCLSHLYRISGWRNSTSSPVLKQRDHIVTELNEVAPSPALK